MNQDSGRVALATDLYQLTMGATYLALDERMKATFSLFVRKLPTCRSYLVTAGLEEAVRRLTALEFDDDDAQYLRSIGRFTEAQLGKLLTTRFTGNVWAVPEGRVVFAGEPLLEVEAPLLEAQLVETSLLNAIHYPTLVATKAARCVRAARGKALVDFGLRRMPGIEASVTAARACYLAGFAGTSNLLAGRKCGIPVSGTMAHSLVELFPSELEAFRQSAEAEPGGLTLLVDTYDTLSGVKHAIQVARELVERRRPVEAIRLDSGDLAELAGQCRRMLDDAGLRQVRIFASGNLDEYEIGRLEAAGAPIDGYGIGTRLGMSADSPGLDMAYKVVAYGDRPCLKLSEGKATVVGAKQVWRHCAGGDRCREDLISARDESSPGRDWEPLLESVVSGGRLAKPMPTLADVRARCARELDSLPEELLGLEAPASPYPVGISDVLAGRQRCAIDEVKRRERLDGRRGDGELHVR
jgi:nicotinate phosphoribosyltransferase